MKSSKPVDDTEVIYFSEEEVQHSEAMRREFGANNFFAAFEAGFLSSTSSTRARSTPTSSPPRRTPS